MLTCVCLFLDQLEEINRQSFASVLCAVSEIDEVFVNAFEVESRRNRLVKCSTFKELNVARCSGKKG